MGIEVSEEFKNRVQNAVWAASVVLGIVMLVLAGVAYGKVNHYTTDFGNIVETWETKPITDFTWRDGATACPTGYDDVTVSWAGTQQACFCGTGNDAKLATRACTSDEEKKGCKTRTPLSSVSTTEFHDGRLCVRRGGVSALARTTLSSRGTCGASERVCNSSTANAFVCWPASERCPITDMVVSTSNNAMYLGDGDVTEVRAYVNETAAMSYYFKREGTFFDSLQTIGLTGFPLVDWEWVPNMPCISSGCGYEGRSAEFRAQEEAYRTSAVPPPHGWKLREECTGCFGDKDSDVSPSGEDMRFVPVDEISEHDLYQSMTGIPAQYITSNYAYKWRVAYRTEVTWGEQCGPSRKDVKSNEDEVNAVRAAQLALLAFALLDFVIITLCQKADQHATKKAIAAGGDRAKLEKHLRDGSKKFLMVKWSLNVAKWSTIIAASVIASKEVTFFNQVREDCTDALTRETFVFLRGTMRSVASLDVAMLVLQVVAAVASLLWWLYQRRKAAAKAAEGSSGDAELGAGSNYQTM